MARWKKFEAEAAAMAIAAHHFCVRRSLAPPPPAHVFSAAYSRSLVVQEKSSLPSLTSP